MKSSFTLLFLAVFFVGFSFGLYGLTKKSSQEKRGYEVCLAITCSEAGGPCLDTELEPYSCKAPGKNATCWDSYYNCTEAGELNDNATEICDCWGPAISCLEASTNTTCNYWSVYAWYGCYEECVFDYESETDTDFCGAAPSIVVPECGEGYCESDVCIDLLPGGAQCTEDYQCLSYDCSYDDDKRGDYGFCYNVTYYDYYGYPGDICTESEDCWSDVCTSGICIGESYGQYCDYEENFCNFGLYCGLNVTSEYYTCMKSLPVGSECTDDDYYGSECVWGSECGYSESEDSDYGVCYASWSVASGGACQYPGECQAGLVCGSNWKCGSPQTATVVCDPYYYGNCSSWGVDSECECNLNTGVTQCVYEDLLLAQCGTFVSSYFSCISTHNCTNTAYYEPQSCVSAFCSSQLNCAFACVILSEAPYFPASCVADEYGFVPSCPSLTTGTTTAAASGGVSTASATASATASVTGSGTASGTASGTSNSSIAVRNIVSYLLIVLVIVFFYF